MWMTNGRRFDVKLSHFAQILGLSSQLDISKKLHSGRLMIPREMTPMYIPNSDFQAPRWIDCFLTFLTLHRMMRKTLAPRNGYSKAIPAYEQNLLDALMKVVCFMYLRTSWKRFGTLPPTRSDHVDLLPIFSA
jgi:hypothetical protein